MVGVDLLLTLHGHLRDQRMGVIDRADREQLEPVGPQAIDQRRHLGVVHRDAHGAHLGDGVDPVEVVRHLLAIQAEQLALAGHRLEDEARHVVNLHALEGLGRGEGLAGLTFLGEEQMHDALHDCI